MKRLTGKFTVLENRRVIIINATGEQFDVLPDYAEEFDSGVAECVNDEGDDEFGRRDFSFDCGLLGHIAEQFIAEGKAVAA